MKQFDGVAKAGFTLRTAETVEDAIGLHRRLKHWACARFSFIPNAKLAQCAQFNWQLRHAQSLVARRTGADRLSTQRGRTLWSL